MEEDTKKYMEKEMEEELNEPGAIFLPHVPSMLFLKVLFSWMLEVQA